MTMIKQSICHLLVVVIAVTLFSEISGHARLSNPPARNTLWRHEEYQWANPHKVPDDNELLCGGLSVTNQYVGACGLCGDNVQDPRPRKWETGGEYDRGIIVRNYGAGETIDVEVTVAAQHDGFFEFRLCPYSVTGVEDDACFLQYPLKFSDGKFRSDAHPDGPRTMRVQLPAGVTCERCVLQFNWWGEGSNQFYKNCADISIR